MTYTLRGNTYVTKPIWKQVLEDVSELTDYPQYQVEDILRGFEQVLMQRLLDGQVTKLWHFGRIEPKRYPIRRYRNPVTGKHAYTRGKKTGHFVPSQYLSKKLNEGLTSTPIEDTEEENDA